MATTNGTPKGIPTGFTPWNTQEAKTVVTKETAKANILSKIKEGAKRVLWTLLWAAAIIAAESLVIELIWNYAFPGYETTYVKTFLLLFMVRLIFRTTVLDKKIEK